MKIKRAFLSYAAPDRAAALRIAEFYRSNRIDVWMDVRDLKPGDMIAERIEKGIRGTDYFTILLSQESVRSKWVQVELDLAFDLSKTGRVVLVPVLLEKVNLPLQLRGLLHVDCSESFEQGMESLLKLVESDDQPAYRFGSGHRGANNASACQQRLQMLEIADLRFQITERLSREDCGVVWFDTFETRLENDIGSVGTGIIAAELIYRARARRCMDKLLNYLCRERPDLATP